MPELGLTVIVVPDPTDSGGGWFVGRVIAEKPDGPAFRAEYMSVFVQRVGDLSFPED